MSPHWARMGLSWCQPVRGLVSKGREQNMETRRDSGGLRAAVIARRTELGMTATDLQRSSGLSPRTVRDIEGAADRRYGTTTLARLDAALGWPVGTAFQKWTGESAPEVVTSIAEQMVALSNRLDRIETEPPWTRGWMALGRRLTPDQRTLLQAVGHQMVAGRDGDS